MKKLLMAALFTLLGVSAASATTNTVTATGGVTISTSGWQSRGEAIVLRIRPSECMTYSYGGGTSPRGTFLFQYSKDRSNWTTLVSSVSLGGLTTATGTKCAEDVEQNVPTFYRMFISSYTSGSYNFTMADANDSVEIKKNNKRLPVWEVLDDGTRNYGNLQVDGKTTFLGGATPYMRTLAQINALTADTTGQIVGCSDCVMVGPGGVCKSSGSVNAGSWTVQMATAPAPSTPLHCQ